MAEASSVGDRWLVTGATGFVGGALVRALAADGIEVHSVVRRPSEDPAVQALGVLTTPHQHDGSTEGLMAIVAAARPTVVAHLASNFIAEHRSDQVEPLVRDNVLFGAQLLEAMRASGVSRLINVGSAWQHYEDREFSPTCLYAATKQAVEGIALNYARWRAVDVRMVRYAAVAGPWTGQGGGELVGHARLRRGVDVLQHRSGATFDRRVHQIPYYFEAVRALTASRTKSWWAF